VPGRVLPLQLTANACKHSYNVSSVVLAYVPRNAYSDRTGRIY